MFHRHVETVIGADVPELGDGTFSADVQVLNYQPIAVEKALYRIQGRKCSRVART